MQFGEAWRVVVGLPTTKSVVGQQKRFKSCVVECDASREALFGFRHEKKSRRVEDALWYVEQITGLYSPTMCAHSSVHQICEC